MTRALTLASVLAGIVALASGCSCENLRPNTQVMVTIDAEPGVRAMARQLVVRVYGAPADHQGLPDALVKDHPYPVAESDGWPVTVALAPIDRDPSRRYRVEAVALSQGGAELATVRAISGYVEGQTLWLRLLLIDGCIGVTCEDPGQTCIGPDECEEALVPAEELPDYEVDAGTVAEDDAGVDAGSSTGVDAGWDAGVPGVDGGWDAGAGGLDAGGPDAGWDAGGPDAGGLDAGWDAGPVDAGWDAGPADAGGVAADGGGRVDASVTDASLSPSDASFSVDSGS